MTNTPESDTRTLLQEVDRLAYVASIGLALAFSAGFFLLWMWQPSNESFWRVVREYALALIPNLVPVFVIFAFSYAFLRKIESIKSNYERRELAALIVTQTQNELRELKNALMEATEKIGRPPIYPTRKATLDASIVALERSPWEKMRIFAPVGLWQKDDDKKHWLEAIAKHAGAKRVREVWAVFGLPPISRYGNERTPNEISEDLEYMRKILNVFVRLKNVEFHYYPPAGASVGVGAIILESLDKTGGELAFGLASHGSEEVVDTGFGMDNQALFAISRQWFDDKIFRRATGNFILHDASKSLQERWSGIVEAWYPFLKQNQ
jgi:hypothetical protein